MGGDFDQIRKIRLKALFAQTKSGFSLATVAAFPAQLQDEIKSRSWFVAEASKNDIMRTDEENEVYWKRLDFDMGEGYTHIANAPNALSLNPTSNRCGVPRAIARSTPVHQTSSIVSMPINRPLM